ncbi:methyltransferase family protein [Hoeflea ulvae]|uniref:Isoprenylcysteine carboxylmethyltransferase family protein n=1 Tax=Hoeflea ulvae TaxID=2983764 RepID=A0ABT3YFZ1_9HYPH|nr:isoprenylcysteine carboxylmethyltransferase family protein [Hoeflea ulvae]MCY0094809.1 isoprenylcysteine carboxylmethyltransferase family protein [Hoeflea ulvae]
MNAYRARPNFIPWPPLLLVGLTLSAILLHLISPVALQFIGARPAGLLLICLALGIDLWAMRTLHEAHTTILPNRRSSHLVTQGPFRFSRNPIYVANLLLIIGMGLVSSNGWFVLLAPVDALLTHFLAVRREENHLLANFGFQYETYCRKVRRWI